MNEADAHRVLLIKAIEESDPEGRILSRTERFRAAVKAKPPEPKPVALHALFARNRPLNPDQESYLARRARLLFQQLEARRPAFARQIREAAALNKGWIVLFMAAFLIGILTNELAPDRRVNILAFPIIGLTLWNLCVYLILAIQALFAPRAPSGEAGGVSWSGALGLNLFSAALRRAHRKVFRACEPEEMRRAVGRFIDDWLTWGQDIHLARAKAILHAAAILLALGAVAGMYLRGLAFEYQAGWGSTFLDADQARQILQWLLAPAVWITGISVPEASQIQALQWSSPGPVDRNAAPWIHLYAVTALLLIVIPRGVLWARANRQKKELADHFPMPRLDDPYFHRLLFSSHGEGETARIISFRFDPSAKAKDHLRTLVVDMLGGRAKIDFKDYVPYGGEDAFLENLLRQAPKPANYLFCVMPMTATPEEESQGLWMAQLKKLMQAGQLARHLAVVLDTSAFLNRFGSQSAGDSRYEERFTLWRRFAEDAGVKLAPINLEDPPSEEGLAALKASVWSPPPPEYALP